MVLGLELEFWAPYTLVQSFGNREIVNYEVS